MGQPNCGLDHDNEEQIVNAKYEQYLEVISDSDEREEYK